MNELITKINDAYFELNEKALTYVWHSLKYHLNEILKNNGSNDYTQPQVNKAKLDSQRRWRLQVKAPRREVEEAINIINPQQHNAQRNEGEDEYEDFDLNEFPFQMDTTQEQVS